MTDSTNSYDGIVIGSGHHGLILASYIARAGLKVLLVERRAMYGGGLNTEERILPGFYHNLHATNHFSITQTPWYRDLGLSTRVRYTRPLHEFSQPHADGTGIVFSHDLDRTLASISRFSPKDAQTFKEWNVRAQRITHEIFLKERFAEPLPEAERREVLSKSAMGRDFLELIQKQPLETVNELFEDERLRVLFLFKLSLFGTVLYETLGSGNPVGSLIRAFDLSTGYELPRGGSWNLARGLMETFIASGGTFVNQTEVDRIIIENNRATGIETSEGITYTASRFVASTVDVHQTFEQMVGRDQLSQELRDRLDKFEYASWGLFGLHLALRDAPDYTAAAFDPDINHAIKYNIGAESVQDLLDTHDDVEEHRIPSKVGFGAGALSVLDPTQAPQGRHTAYAWHVVPYEVAGDPDYVDSVKDEFADKILDKWSEYAPNMTRDNVLGSYVHTPRHYSQELINMKYGDIMMGSLGSNQVMDRHFGYRPGIENLYMAGSAAHPNGSLSGGAGYITAGIIADDIGLDAWWPRTDLREDLAGIVD